MIDDRRTFIQHSLKWGLAAATAPFWNELVIKNAIAQASTASYKAIVVITLAGGNDSNNLLIPLDADSFAEYTSLRSTLALPASAILPLPADSGSPTYGLHPRLKNVAGFYAQKRAAVIANIGPLAQPATKQQLIATPSLYPQSLLSHPAGQNQWESATTVTLPSTGWGGRIADLIAQESGLLPPVLNSSVNSLFPIGNTVQGVAVQSGGVYPALPPGMNAALLQIADKDANASNRMVSQIAKMQASAFVQQSILTKAMGQANVTQRFTGSALGLSLKAIAQLIAGRSVIGAYRQLFYTQQTLFDTHANQLPAQDQLLGDLDANLGSFFAALDDLNLSDDVLVCTHSDFSRTMTSNTNLGSDHAWGSHQLVLGGGINGGRIIGTFPTLELGGPDDLDELGIWIPTTSVTQLAAAIGDWLGLNKTQIASVFPDLANFANGFIKL